VLNASIILSYIILILRFAPPGLASLRFGYGACTGLPPLLSYKGFWEQASEGTLPLPFAAWLTNAAYVCAANLCMAVIDIDKDAQERSELVGPERGTPTINFRRFLGGTSPVDRHWPADARHGRRVIGLPATCATARDYAKRLMPSEMSLSYELHNQRFATTMDFWSRLYKGRRASSPTKIQRDDIIKDLNAIGYTGLLTK